MTGKTISHYRILEKLGGGGMGVVYKAEDTKLGRLVALKCLAPNLVSDPAALERFTREARAACALNHPHIVTVHDAGVADGTYFIVTELVEGQTLRALLKAREAMDATKSLKIARQILEALRAAHGAGIVHRDLKPENVMLRPDGYVKVLDFGLAKLLPESPLRNAEGDLETRGALTAAGSILGTVAYMSPEQALGQTVDHRSDLFSFGIILYEMTVGAHPWPRGSPLEILHAILHEDVPAGSAASHPGLQSLLPVIQKALLKNPSARYQSAEQVLADLEALPALSAELPEISGEPERASSIAVLPFLFLSAVEEKESLSLGFADALITTLGNLQGLVVPPTSAILKYPGGSDPATVSRQLGVRHVLQGNIQKVGLDWRVSMQLFDARAQRTILSEKYDFTLGNIFEVQDQIAERVAESLKQRFRAGTPKSRERYSTDPYAYDEFMRGLRASYLDGPESLETAIQHLENAVERDPEFALAHAALSRAYGNKHYFYDPRSLWSEKAEAHCQRAIELDANLAEARVARAQLLWSPLQNFRHGEALAELRKALAIHPHADGAHFLLGGICIHIGRMKEAVQAYQKLRRLNPENPWHHAINGAYFWSGEFERAIPETEAWLRASPESKIAMWWRPQPALLMGDLKSAASLLAEPLQRFPEEPLFISLQGLLQALRGEAELALDCVRRSCESPRSFGHMHHAYYLIASIYSVLGETQKSLGWLERSVETGFPCWPFFRCDPTLKNLRALPEFDAFAGKLERIYSQIDIASL